MKKLFSDKRHAYHLSEYAILENHDGTYEYMTWQPDPKDGKLLWLSGEAKIFGDVLGLTRITSEGEEETLATPQEVQHELEQLPKWDKTKYYCVIVLEREAGFVCYCETGSRIEEDGEDYQTVKKILEEHGVILLFQGAIGFEARDTHTL